MSGYMLDVSWPLFKENEKILSIIEPKLNLRFSPHEMKNHKSTGSRINASNVYSFSRLGLSDSIEDGASLTIGIDYKKEEKRKISSSSPKSLLREQLVVVVVAMEVNIVLFILFLCCFYGDTY